MAKAKAKAKAKARKRKARAVAGGVGAGLVKAGLSAAAGKALDAWLRKDSGGRATEALRAALPAARSSIEIVEGPRAQRVILLPSRGMRSSAADTKKFLMGMTTSGAKAAVRAVGGPPTKMKLVDSIRDDGAKLVEATAEDLQKLRAAQPGLVVVPERFFDLAVSSYRVERSARAAAGGAGALQTLTVQVISRSTGKPVVGATVVAFTNFAAREGAQGLTSSKGTVSLKLPASTKRLERVYVYPKEGMLWGALRNNVALASASLQLKLDPIDLGVEDSLRYFAGAGDIQDGKGVKVGVVDTGIALKHPDLHVLGGECTVPGEKPSAFGPLGGDHGSHCAGIIAARGSAPSGVRGIAPAAGLYSLRVFPKETASGQESGASNFAIAKAIDRAVAFGCDILNLSLGGGAPDAATTAAIQDAYNAGVVVIAAAGNDDRQPVSFPASDDLCVAVSAVGRKGLFPKGSVYDGDVAAPYGKDKKNFIAAFSNIGADLDCTGPGVAVVSTIPANSYTAMSGTSMATPAVTGLAARMLAKNPTLLGATRNSQRAGAIVKALLGAAKTLGFAATFQGRGLPT